MKKLKYVAKLLIPVSMHSILKNREKCFIKFNRHPKRKKLGKYFF